MYIQVGLKEEQVWKYFEKVEQANEHLLASSFLKSIFYIEFFLNPLMGRPAGGLISSINIFIFFHLQWVRNDCLGGINVHLMQFCEVSHWP